jgi:hypothetical protein
LIKPENDRDFLWANVNNKKFAAGVRGDFLFLIKFDFWQRVPV